jgi:hypothetical protein
VRPHFPLAALALVLAGCASGSCSDHRLLQPGASPIAGFSVDVQSDYDALFLEGPSVALWLEPCTASETRALLQATLCGTVIVSPGTRFTFLNAQAQVRDRSQSLEPIAIRPTGFKIGAVEVGSSKPGVASWLVNRPYKLPGSRLPFVVFDQPYIGGPIELLLPPIEVNSLATAFPSITITPAVGRRCYRGAW